MMSSPLKILLKNLAVLAWLGVVGVVFMAIVLGLHHVARGVPDSMLGLACATVGLAIGGIWVFLKGVENIGRWL